MSDTLQDFELESAQWGEWLSAYLHRDPKYGIMLRLRDTAEAITFGLDPDQGDALADWLRRAAARRRETRRRP